MGFIINWSLVNLFTRQFIYLKKTTSYLSFVKTQTVVIKTVAKKYLGQFSTRYILKNELPKLMMSLLFSCEHFRNFIFKPFKKKKKKKKKMKLLALKELIIFLEPQTNYKLFRVKT